MEYHNIINSLTHGGERVTSTYAEIYLDDEYCDYKKPQKDSQVQLNKNSRRADGKTKEEWVSPSDLLIGIIDLKPPFTSKITRGTTHEGILRIGNDILEKEHAIFLKNLNNLIKDNDLSWIHVQEHEKDIIIKKVRQIYNDIFLNKSKIMQKELTEYYEKSLLELEEHVRTEVKNVLLSVNANMISDLNVEIKRKLLKEKVIVEQVLKKKYEQEVKKIKLYYELLLNNELHRKNRLINRAFHERNDALKAFCRSIEAENVTSTMYVMCTERKKCRMKQFLLANIQSAEIADKLQKIRERQTLIDSYKQQVMHIADINRNWEEKVAKILRLFLKFISFSLKLLPEQTTFLLDLEKMVVLQLNEIQKHPTKQPVPILIQQDDLLNTFKFEEQLPAEEICVGDPFVVEADIAESIPTPYGSQETIPLGVELPFVRLQRQYIYAKCQKIEQVRTFLESLRCKCRDKLPKLPSDASVPSTSSESWPPPPQEVASALTHGSESSNEPLLVEDIHRLHACPARNCQDWIEKEAFPDMNCYLDFTEENLSRVQAILGKLPVQDCAPELTSAKDVAYSELRFAATKEPCHEVGTQYSSQEDLLAYVPAYNECQCISASHVAKLPSSSPSININEVVQKRKASLIRLMQDHPKLVEVFTNESYDFRL